MSEPGSASGNGANLPVLSEVRALEPSRAASPAVQAAAVAATGFAAGAATIAVWRRRRARRAARGGRGGKRGEPRDILGTRSFLIDVHLLDRH